MIVSYEHNFIFVKTRKTAGTSMEIALGTQVGEKDVITPLATEDEFVRLELQEASLPRNYLTEPHYEEEYRAAVRKRDVKEMKRLRKKVFPDLYTVFNHASSKRAIKVLGEETWKKAFKFAVERHPYEKAVSMAWFRKGDDDFPKALEETIGRAKFRNYDLYTFKGEVAVDYIIRYEDLANCVKHVEDKLGGLKIFENLPQAKGAHRVDRSPAADQLTAEQKSRIQKICAEEFALMGYPE